MFGIDAWLDWQRRDGHRRIVVQQNGILLHHRGITATAEVTSATTAVATATAKSSSTAATVSDPQLVGLSTSSVEPIMLSILFVFILSGSRLPHVHAIARQ